ncbi:hypothetical protein ABIA07_004843 [Bradyrhizobium yuanmingense]
MLAISCARASPGTGRKARLFGPTATRPISSRSVSAAKGSGDVHLGQPLGELLRQTSDAYPGVTVRAPATGEHECALRFFANGRLEEADISAATSPPRARITTIFLIQDTSEFSFQRPDTSAICMTQSVHSSRDKVGGFYCLTWGCNVPLARCSSGCQSEVVSWRAGFEALGTSRNPPHAAAAAVPGSPAPPHP